MPEHVRVDIVAPSDLWASAIEELPQLVTRTVTAAVKATARVLRSCEVCVVLSDDRELQLLNKDYRDIDKPTNVLSFPGEPLDDDEESYSVGSRPMVLGDIVVAYETMEREASTVPMPLADHLMHILIHGVLHLCRFDHENEQDAEQMEALESAILLELGIPDPYSPPSAPKRTVKKRTAKRTRAASPKNTASKAAKRNR